MKHSITTVRILLSIVVMSVIVQGPAAVPIIEPRVTIRTLIACQGQTAGTVIVKDSRGFTYTLTCGGSSHEILGHPGLLPTSETPWQVAITAVPPDLLWSGLPQICWLQVTGLPAHLQCPAASGAPLIVDLQEIATFDQGILLL